MAGYKLLNLTDNRTPQRARRIVAALGLAMILEPTDEPGVATPQLLWGTGVPAVAAPDGSVAIRLDAPTPGEVFLARISGAWVPAGGGGSAGASPPVDVIYRPGGVALGNVHTDWPSVVTALNAVPDGAIRLLVDNSLGALTIPSSAGEPGGVWTLPSQMQIWAFNFGGGPPPALEFADLARLSMLPAMFGVGATSNSTTFVYEQTAGFGVWFSIGGTELQAAGVGRMLRVAAGATIQLLGIDLKSNTSEVVDLVGAGAAINTDSSVETDTIAGVVGTTHNAEGTADIEISGTQTNMAGTTNVDRVDVAFSTSYTASTPADWAVSTPNNVRDAIDRLAAAYAASHAAVP